MKARFAIALASALCAGLAQAQFYSAPIGSTPGSGRIPVTAPSGIRIDQRLNSVINSDWSFTDQFGQARTTGEIFSKRPSILLLIFYRCTSVCAVELESAIKAIRGIKKEDVGDLYNFVVVSIDPREGPAEAKQRYEEVLAKYDRKNTEDGFIFLSGDEKNIQGLADQVGFKFYRDPKTGNITHPAGMIVVGSDRRVMRYFIDQTYDPKPVLQAIKDAKDGVVGAKDDRPFFLACIDVDPMTGTRSLNVLNAIRTGGVLTVLGLITSILIMNRNSKLEMKRRQEEAKR